MDAQKTKIQQAALSLFSERGYSGTTLAAIAAEAGVNPALIYQHFSGKRALFDSLQRPELDFQDSAEVRRREEIVQSALQVFSQKGYAAATMDEIAEFCQLSKPALYFYYPSKEALFEAAMKSPVGFEVILPMLEKFSTETEFNLEEGLTQITAAYLNLFKIERFVCLMKIILSEGTHNPRIAREFTEKVVGEGSDLFVNFIKRYLKRDEDELRAATQSLFGMLFSWGLTHVLLASEDSFSENEIQSLAHRFVRQFLFGVIGDREHEMEQKE